MLSFRLLTLIFGKGLERKLIRFKYPIEISNIFHSRAKMIFAMTKITEIIFPSSGIDQKHLSQEGNSLWTNVIIRVIDDWKRESWSKATSRRKSEGSTGGSWAGEGRTNEGNQHRATETSARRSCTTFQGAARWYGNVFIGLRLNWVVEWKMLDVVIINALIQCPL